MKTLSLALRNLLRNRRRSLATLLAMAIGSAAILLFGGYAANIKYSMLTEYVRNGGHLQVQHRDYYLYGSGNPVAYGIGDHERVLRAIAQDPVLGKMVVVATPTLQFGGLAGNYDAGVSRTIIGNGLVAPDINRMRAWNEYGLPGEQPRFALDGAGPGTAIVGMGVARVLQLCEALRLPDCPAPEAENKPQGKSLPADIAQLSALESGPSKGAAETARGGKIELLASNANGTPNVAAVRVIKAESQGFKELDEVYVVMQLDEAQRLVYGRQPAKVTSIMIQLQRTEQIGEARERLKTVLHDLGLKQPLTVLDFEQINPFYVQTVQLFGTIFGFIFVLIGGIVLFTVSNTMNTAVVERTIEIGTLRAIGLRQSGIRRLFITEGWLLGLSGALVGVLAAILASAAINRSNLTWLPPGSAEHLPLLLRVWGEHAMIVGTTVGQILIAAASAWWPAYRAAKLNVVEALRHV